MTKCLLPFSLLAFAIVAKIHDKTFGSQSPPSRDKDATFLLDAFIQLLVTHSDDTVPVGTRVI